MAPCYRIYNVLDCRNKYILYITSWFSVDSLLQNSEVQVIIYSGQYDVVCCTKGRIADITHILYTLPHQICTVYPTKYAHDFVVLCFVVVMQSFIMNSHEIFIHIHQGCFAGTGAIVRLPQCQWSKPDGYGKISQSITTTKHSKAKTVCIFLGIYCTWLFYVLLCCGCISRFYLIGVNLLQGWFTGTRVISLLPQCQWSNPEGYGYNRINTHTIRWPKFVSKDQINSKPTLFRIMDCRKKSGKSLSGPLMS